MLVSERVHLTIGKRPPLIDWTSLLSDDVSMDMVT